MKNIFLSCCTFFLLLACSSNPRPQGDLKSDLTKRLFELWDSQTGKLSDNQIAAIADQQGKLPQPFRLAVFFQEPVAEDKSNWRWSRQDKQTVMSGLANINQQKVKRVFELINTRAMEAEALDLKTMRLMAAQQGADALLLIQGQAEVASPPNGWAATYLAVLPVLFVRGNDVQGNFVSQAVLWDVRTPQVHLGLESEGVAESSRPLAFRRVPRIVGEAKTEALQALSQKLQQTFNQMQI